MPQKLATVLAHLEKMENLENKKIILEYHKYLVSRDTSTNYQKDNIKLVMMFGDFLGDQTFGEIKSKETIIAFLDTKKKSNDVDPEQKWITTWNDYLWRIKMFYRWYYNVKANGIDIHDVDDIEWITPDIVNINKKKTKRLSPYYEGDIWDKEELLSIVKYEPYKRNKAILTLLWDLNARPHEITLLRIKNIRLREKYGEGEVPHEAKTGSGPVLLSCSFPYVRDWLNEHPFSNEPSARLICNKVTGSPVSPDSIWDMMRQLRKRIVKLLENGEIKDQKERTNIEHLLKTKKWNPYCIRHSSITADSDYLPEYALKKKVRWSMNSKQGLRYIKSRMGNDLKEKILVYNGIIKETEKKKRPSILNCPRCELVNIIENKYCSKCSYPLKPEAYDEIKESEEKRLKNLEEKQRLDIINIKEEMNKKFNCVISMIQQNPLLSQVKSEVLQNKNNK